MVCQSDFSPNLIRFCNDKLGTDLAKEPATVEPGSRDIFNYPYVHMTGHGNVVFTEVEAHNLREYLLGGGFLHADDNYGLAQAFRREMKKVFPEDELVRFPGNIRFLIRNINFRRGYPKSMNTMRNGRKLWGSSRKEDWWFYLLSRPTWEMAGKILRCTTILKTNGRRLCRWERILFLMCFPTEKRLK